MMRVYRFDAIPNFMYFVSDTWMCLERGEGEKEIANHGWSGVKSFSQETEAIGQQRSRSDQYEPKLYSKSQVQDAHDSPTQLPFFSFSRSVAYATTLVKSGFLGTLLFGQSSLVSETWYALRSVARCFYNVLQYSNLLWNLIRVPRNPLFTKVVDMTESFERKKEEFIGSRFGVVSFVAGGFCG